MADPFVAEIRIFPFNFAPKGWAFCDGHPMAISQNTALFSLLGTFYGGDGKTTFALPNLSGAAPMHQGQGPGLSDRFLGETGGADFVTLIDAEMPAHNHGLMAANFPADIKTPTANTALARSTGGNAYQDNTSQNLVLHELQQPAHRRLEPAAQQPDAVPDAQLQHRPAGRVPAARLGPVHWLSRSCPS